MDVHKIMGFWGGMQRPTQLLEVTVVGCYNLEDRWPVATEYSCVLLEYGGSTKRTKPCQGGGKHLVFEEKVVFEFTEGVRELKVAVWTSQPPGNGGVIGFLSVQLQQVLSDGYVDSTWTLQRKDGRPAGHIRLILQFPSSSSTFQRQNSSYTAPSLNSAAPLTPDVTQPPILSQLLPYDSFPPTSPAVPRPNATYPCTTYPPNSAPPPQPLYPPTRPTQPNATGPAALWSQLLPYGSSTAAVPPPAAPAYNVPYPSDPYPHTQPMSSYCPSTSPPAGYPRNPHPHPHPHHRQYPTYPPRPPGPSSDIYPPPSH